MRNFLYLLIFISFNLQALDWQQYLTPYLEKEYSEAIENIEYSGVINLRNFKTSKRLNEHYLKHEDLISKLYKIQGKNDYLKAARNFGLKTGSTVLVFAKYQDQKIYKFDILTSEFLVLNFDNQILTYFIPESRVHKCQTNLQYFLTKWYKDKTKRCSRNYYDIAN